MEERFLLISDLDDTLLGDAGALERFAEFHRSLDQRLDFVYASGRFFSTIEVDVQTSPLPEPLAVIGGVGSEIRGFPSGELNQRWVQRISEGWSAEKVQQVLADEPEMRLQPAESQSDFKVSYYLHDASSEQLERLREKLLENGLKVSMIYSSARDLDFLPAGVDKGTAAVFMASELGFSKNRVMVSGNSGNDSRLFDHDFQGIVVNNAHDDLKQYAKGPRIFLASRDRADGVREGIEHWISNAVR